MQNFYDYFNMKKIRVLRVIFDEKIKSYEVPALRGAIIHKVGKDSLLFHNHEGDGFRYAYPLIQYKQWYGNAALVCIGEGVDEIHRFFSNPNWELEISGRTLPMKIKQLEMNDFTLQVWNQQFDYEIRDWLALNPQSYQEYRHLTDENERQHFLAKKLIGNILSFAKGIDWHIEKQLTLEITSPIITQNLRIKDVQMMGFSLQFRTNVSLPYGIGLGKSVSLGYGVIRKQSAVNC